MPFFGQGMNAAMEDCTVLDQCIDGALHRHKAPSVSAAMSSRDFWRDIFDHYQQSRKENADAIATMAVENLVEMSEKTADRRFLFKKEVQHLLGQRFAQFRSRYELVSFSNMPYADAYRRGELNDAITDRLINDNTLFNIDKIDLALAKSLIEQTFGSPDHDRQKRAKF